MNIDTRVDRRDTKSVDHDRHISVHHRRRRVGRRRADADAMIAIAVMHTVRVEVNAVVDIDRGAPRRMIVRDHCDEKMMRKRSDHQRMMTIKIARNDDERATMKPRNETNHRRRRNEIEKTTSRRFDYQSMISFLLSFYICSSRL